MKRYLLSLVRICSLAFIVCSGTLWAETSGLRMEPPVLGYVFEDATKQIRPISGVPGAAALGDAVSLPVTLAEAVIHSASRSAIALTKAGHIALARWEPEARVAELETQLKALHLAVFSRSGNWAAITDGSVVELWNAGSQPTLEHRWTALGDLVALAVNPDGAVLVANAEGSLARLSGDAVDVLAGSGEWTALAYAENGDGLAADALHHELVRLTPDGGRNVVATLPGAANAVAEAGGIVFASSGEWGLLAAGGPVADCGCRPTGLELLSGGALYARGTALVVDVAPEAQEGLRLTALHGLLGSGVQQ